jgi:hypothetical protein
MTDTDPDERSPATEASESATELSPLLTALRETEERHNGDAVAGSTREREQLLRAVTEAVVTEPAAAVDGEPFDASVGGLARDLGREAQRTVARALSAAAADRADTIAREIDTVRPLLDTDDPVVAAWVAGALGRVAETHADAVAPAAMDLAALAEHENRTVRHNAVEALAAVAQECPGAVAPAADALRPLLSANDVAIQHNATGVFGVLAATHPDAVTPAAETIADLRSHGERAVQQVAAGTLARLAQERSDVVESVTD